MTDDIVYSIATISDDELYRYTLRRSWDLNGKHDLWIMLNPSTADSEEDDPTIRRCMNFSRREGSTGIDVVNLYAYRTSSPKELWAVQQKGIDIIGPGNDAALRNSIAAATGRIIVAWGANMTGVAYPMWVRGAIYFHGWTPYCLGTTQSGQPRHPLMVRKDQPFVIWPGFDD